MQYSGNTRGHTLKEVADGGRTVVLEDGSAWEVYEGYASRAAKWELGDLVGVKASTDDEYPYLLINVNFNNSVECRLIRDHE
ncbi:MAG: hypothetical protein R3188_00655 [Acidiferrobacterales bacterium]|jgi:hypothetical protein|nr:hypothetical protein [Acidiferrobacterales bacterium]